MTSITDASPQEARARQTLERVASGLAGGGVAGMAEIVKLVEALAANASHITVSEMAELIEKDVVVAAFGRVAKNTLRPIATTARRLTADTTSFLVRDHLTLGLFAIDPRFLSTLTAQSGLFLMLRAPICDEPVRELCGA